MPALRPLFTRVLDVAMTSPGSSKATFQKIGVSHKPNTDSRVPRSSTISAQSSVRGNNIRKTVEFRVSSQLDLEIYRDEEFQDELAIPAFLDRSRRRSFSEYDDDIPIQPGGYRHIDLPVPVSPHFRDTRM